ncbi:band 4.1-like protein 4, partial [Pseudochaenichthys georgianus]|uniref:band 4.1-like protein 4 n=1 Tax=Pseudochaenichthys georgianus TaxID=52239 RepID=UPI00146E1114
MMACFRGNREDFYGEVLLLDESKLCLTSEQGIKKSSKAAAILRLVFCHLKIAQVEFFGLRFCDRNQQTDWLHPQKALSQHRGLVGPPYIFYFGVKFYAQDPSELEDEATLCQFYLQVRQDVHHGRLPCPPSLKPRLSALMLLVDGGERSDVEPTEEIKTLCETLSCVSGPQVQRYFLFLCSSLETFGVSLFPVYGEGGKEYFLGPTPAAVLVYRSRELLGKYL